MNFPATEHCEACKALRDCSNRLYRLSRVFHEVGNDKISTELFDVAANIDGAIDAAEKAMDERGAEALKFSREMVGGLLSATLAGAIRNPGAKDEP